MSYQLSAYYDNIVFLESSSILEVDQKEVILGEDIGEILDHSIMDSRDSAVFSSPLPLLSPVLSL
jgi:hypothetical protein